MNFFKRIKLSRISQGKTNNRNRAALLFLCELGFSLPAVRGALIKLNNVNVADLARNNDITAPTIYAAAYGKRSNPRGRAIIAQTLGVDVADLFPPENGNGAT